MKVLGNVIKNIKRYLELMTDAYEEGLNALIQ